jgi:hypothetical protein
MIKWFVQFAKEHIREHYSEDEEATHKDIEEVFQEAWNIVDKSNKKKGQKDNIKRLIEKAFDTRAKQRTYSNCFIKREITQGTNVGWPRNISAREPLIRTLSATSYEYVQKQVYLDPNMIKGMNSEQVIDDIVGRLNNFKHILCFDVSSYDSAQAG